MNKRFPLDGKDLLAIAGFSGLVLTILGKLGVSDYKALIAALAVFVTATVIWSQARIWQYEGDRFRLERTKEGDDALSPLSNCHDMILTTHFGTTVPSDHYIRLMLGKLDTGVHIARIVARNAKSETDTKKWLDKFSEKKRYVEYVHKAMTTMPFDFTIIDRAIVILYLPQLASSAEFNRALIFNNREVAEVFHSIFERLKADSVEASRGGGDATVPRAQKTSRQASSEAT